MFGVFIVVVLISLVPGTSSPDHQQIFTGHTGKDVTLKFHVPNDTTSIWLKIPGSEKYIFHCRDGHAIRPKDQEESFMGRVEGIDCDKLNGSVSVTVKNLTSSDNGTYELHSVHSDERRFNKTIFLIVTDPVNPLIYVPCVGLVVCIVIGLVYKGRRRKSQISLKVLEPQSVKLAMVVVEEEEDAAVRPSEKKSPLMKSDSAVF